MNDATAINTETATPVPVTVAPGWRVSLIAWAVLVTAIILLFWKDSADIVSQWWNNATYQHCLLIPPIIAYLVWQRRAEVGQLTPRPFLPAAALLLVGGLGWLLGQYAGVGLVRHAALVGMLIVSVPLVFGLTVARGLLFPLFYALFMIPVGDQLIPALQMITADMCIFLLDLFDVPAFIDGVFIYIPTGSFEVAEACSGVRFLIAMIAFSTLVAHLCFKSTLRRIVCVVSAIALSIIANGLRAWGTIYIAHLTTPAFAAGVDHVVYGWFFFAFVMAIVLGVGWFFFDRPVDDPAFDPRRLQPRTPAIPLSKAFGIAAGLGVIAIAAAPVYGMLVGERAADQQTAMIELPDVSGWTKVPTQGSGWQPIYENASASASQSYRDAEGRQVDLFIAIYDRQDDEQEMISYGNGLFEPDGDWSWAQNLANPPGGRGVQLQRVPYIRDVWHYYLVGDALTGSDYGAKMATLKTRLLGGPTRAATIIVSSEHRDSSVNNVPAIADFVGALGDLQAALDQAAVAEAVAAE
ncbi:exosortase A [Pacificimonas sp. WHA3]|uniref:Exosortase A n=1 Tax=Pacificimonas pallii TaxID=2827236 RepID=A0ABS6SFD2_9SPHN|nr:exosortase A [Pacificimonas pallii]MBV7257104.1 exosortase A [Pacificimonas pallii]